MRNDTMMKIRWRATLLLPAALLVLSGCGHQSVRGTTIVYAYDWWLAPLLILLAAMCGMASLQLRRERRPLAAWALCIAGPLVAVALTPGVILNGVTIDPEHFEIRYGFWWASQHHHVRFDDLESIQIVTRVAQGGRSKNYYTDLVYVLRGGGHVTLSLDGDLRREAGPDIINMAKARGVIRD